MQDINQASWIHANVEAVENYLKQEFENFAVVHVENKPVAHIFKVTDGKKRFKLLIPWSVLAEQDFSQRASGRLLYENVAAEMRLHGERGYHWTSEQ